MKTRTQLILITTALLSLLSCLQRPEAGDYAAPEFGEIEVDVNEYKATVSCPVLNVREGETFGFRYGRSGERLKEIRLVPENGLLKAQITGLDAPAQYTVTAFAANGKNEISSDPNTFTVTEDSPAAVIPDPVFKKYCLANFDLNSDGKISVSEAERVAIINVCTDSISSVKGIEFFPNLQELHARGGMVDGEWIRKGNLMSLDVSGNSNLRIIDCEDNLLREVDLSHNTELIDLNLSWNHISSIDVTMLPLLATFNVSVNEGISSVDVTNNPKLWEYHGNGLGLSCLPDLSNCHFLQSLHIGGTGGAKYIDRPDYLAQWPELLGANISEYPLDRIDLSANLKMDSIWASDMPNMEVFDLSPLVKLHSIYVNNCPVLKKILVNDNVDISSLYVEKNGTGRLKIIHKSEMD